MGRSTAATEPMTPPTTPEQTTTPSLVKKNTPAPSPVEASADLLHRPRRLRQSPFIRDLVRENQVSLDSLIAPIFVVPGNGARKEIGSMPGQFQLSVDQLGKHCTDLLALGIKSVILFGIPDHKDEIGSAAWRSDGIIQLATRAIKKAVPEMVVVSDLCFCEYTSHGHCGVMTNQQLNNDATLLNLVKQAISHCEAGVDIIAPSGMIDGMVGAIRNGLDESGFVNTPIMAYSAKFASAFYGPFREAVESTPQYGDRRTYQMDPANAEEALREVAFDIEQGADIVMIKPALAYLDVIRRVKDTFQMPTAAYQVSGEYAMVKAAANNGWIDGDRAMDEILMSLKRAGSDIIITYFAADFAKRRKAGLC